MRKRTLLRSAFLVPFTRVSGVSADTKQIVQIVLQWKLEDVNIWLDFFWLETRLEHEAQGLYVVDGNDVGGGMFNVYLLTGTPDPAVRRVLELFKANRLRPNLRIAVAENYSPDRRNWTYRLVFPDSGGPFELGGR